MTLRHTATAALIAAALGLGACRGIVDTVYPVNVAPSSIHAGSYSIDPSHAGVIFNIRHMELARFYGRIPVKDGSLAIDPDSPETAKLQVTMDAAGLDTANPVLDEKLRDLVSADEYPEITFESISVVRTGEATANVTGNLTIAKATKPVTLVVTFAGRRTDPLSGDDRMGFDATGTIRLSEFGLSAVWTPFVADELDLTIGAEFTRQK
ncbi:YceI family protein [Gimibacter soli]|uniref:YceI family protein n=1 Tax=Gimibacter soli TaxID=3024400 RepID=A0AAE9XWG0_9PROT|nr:YceI family protein [Gimibacter soli]WCL54564.1 YceI family protein [Gimibacter soli]